MIKVSNTPAYDAEALQERVRELLGRRVVGERIYRGDLAVEVHVGSLSAVIRDLKDDDALDMNMLASITAVHWPGEPLEYEVIYHLRSLTRNLFMVVKTRVARNREVPSLSGLYKTADWQEREVYDLMGVQFSGHPNLRRILMPEPYPWHPLRKEFPVDGPDFPVDGYQTDAAGKVEGDDFWDGSAEAEAPDAD